MPIRLTVAHRERLLDAMRDAVVECGYTGLECRPLCRRAGYPNNLFYELFADKEECLLALLEREVAGLAQGVSAAYESKDAWRDRVHAGLGALLEWLDGHPASANVLFVQSLAAGPRVLARRQEVLDRLAQAVDEGRLDGRGRERAKQPPELTAMAVVGGACGLIASHIVTGKDGDAQPIADLLPVLMASIVFPYMGRAAAQRELGSDKDAGSGRRGASRSRTHRAKFASQMSEGGRRDAPPIVVLRAVVSRAV